MEELKLYEWQKKAIAICKERENFAIFAQVGTGKTCTSIQILRDKCNKERRILKTLILGPVAVIYNWRNEILKFSNIPDNLIYVCTGTGASRAKKLENFLLAADSSIIITNYESLRNKSLYALLEQWSPDIVYLDESHLCKSPDSQQSKLTYLLAKKIRYKYLLTGTPILNSPMDIFMQYKIMDGGATFGRNFFAFRARYFLNENATKPWMNFPKWVPNESMYPELMEKMHASCIRVRSDECLDLPPLIEQTYHVEMNAEQKRIYKEMKKDFMTYVKGKLVVAELALTKALRLQQIVSGFCQTEEGKIIEIENIPRLKVVKELLEQITLTDKCILWCSFKFSYRQLEKVCTELGLEYVSITGEQSAQQKQESCDRFQDPKGPKIAICNRKAAGLGINLTEAAYSIVYSRNFSLAEEIQSAGRNYRGGSEKHKRIVKIDLVVKNSIEEIVIKALKNKDNIAKVLVDRIKEL